ncbi:hypothetical protein [Geminicoccus flavidas]|uniref:hypothetical protein n=1 Tax=Geminicoccus flavidas TaxID=2506407 RepID=UPI00135C12AB|nr:hypothetical protein [Geminicoccus flavidas]
MTDSTTPKPAPHPPNLAKKDHAIGEQEKTRRLANHFRRLTLEAFLAPEKEDLERQVWDVCVAALEAAGKSGSIDKKIAQHVSTAVKFALRGQPHPLWKATRGYSKTASIDATMLLAIGYAEMCHDGLIDDPSPAKTIKKAHGISHSTYNTWRRQCREYARQYYLTEALASAARAGKIPFDLYSKARQALEAERKRGKS